MPHLTLNRALGLAFALVCLCAGSARAGGPLSQATLQPIGVPATDIVYDAVRNRFYLSVSASAAPTYGNALAIIDPATAAVVRTNLLPDEPGRLVMARDNSRVYISQPKSLGFRWWEPATDQLSPLFKFDAGPYGAGYQIRDMAVAPDDPHLLALLWYAPPFNTGYLAVFREGQKVGTLGREPGAGSLAFVDSRTLLGFDTDGSGTYVWSWVFDGAVLTQSDLLRGLSGNARRLKVADGLVYAETGRVISPSPLRGIGTYGGVPDWAGVGVAEGGETVYFLGTTFQGPELAQYDRRTYLQTDRRIFTGFREVDRGRIVAVGRHPSFAGDRLGFVQADGSAGVITVPDQKLAVTVLRATDQGFRLSWASEPGRHYRLQWSADFMSWTTFQTVTAAQYETTQEFPSPGGQRGQEYYRVLRD